MVATKTKKSIDSRLQFVMKSEKYVLRNKQTLKMIRQGKVKLVIFANCPALRKSEIEYYTVLAKTSVYHYNGNNIQLVATCRKYYRISTLATSDPGDSDTIRSMRKTRLVKSKPGKFSCDKTLPALFQKKKKNTRVNVL